MLCSNIRWLISVHGTLETWGPSRPFSRNLWWGQLLRVVIRKSPVACRDTPVVKEAIRLKREVFWTRLARGSSNEKTSSGQRIERLKDQVWEKFREEDRQGLPVGLKEVQQTIQEVGMVWKDLAQDVDIDGQGQNQRFEEFSNLSPTHGFP